MGVLSSVCRSEYLTSCYPLYYRSPSQMGQFLPPRFNHLAHHSPTHKQTLSRILVEKSSPPVACLTLRLSLLPLFLTDFISNLLVPFMHTTVHMFFEVLTVLVHFQFTHKSSLSPHPFFKVRPIFNNNPHSNSTFTLSSSPAIEKQRFSYLCKVLPFLLAHLYHNLYTSTFPPLENSVSLCCGYVFGN